jgi:hypothetical protein
MREEEEEAEKQEALQAVAAFQAAQAAEQVRVTQLSCCLSARVPPYAPAPGTTQHKPAHRLPTVPPLLGCSTACWCLGGWGVFISVAPWLWWCWAGGGRGRSAGRAGGAAGGGEGQVGAGQGGAAGTYRCQTRGAASQEGKHLHRALSPPPLVITQRLAFTAEKTAGCGTVGGQEGAARQGAGADGIRLREDRRAAGGAAGGQREPDCGRSGG